MHETVHVVDATDAWHRVIVQPDGSIAYDLDLGFTEWDGDTAIVDLDTGVDAGHPDYDYLEPGPVRRRCTPPSGRRVMGGSRQEFGHLLRSRHARWRNDCRQR